MWDKQATGTQRVASTAVGGRGRLWKWGWGGGDLNPVLVGSSERGGGCADCPGLHPEGRSNRALGPRAGFIVATPSERHGEECGGGGGVEEQAAAWWEGEETPDLGVGGKSTKSTHRTRRLFRDSSHGQGPLGDHLQRLDGASSALDWVIGEGYAGRGPMLCVCHTSIHSLAFKRCWKSTICIVSKTWWNNGPAFPEGVYRLYCSSHMHPS